MYSKVLNICSAVLNMCYKLCNKKSRALRESYQGLRKNSPGLRENFLPERLWKVAEGFALQTIQQYLSNIQTDKRKAERLKGFSGNKIALYAREDSEDSEELIHGQIGKVKIMTARAVISRWNQWILDISGLFPTINETVRAMILPILR